MYNCGEIQFENMPLLIMVPWLICICMLWLLLMVNAWLEIKGCRKKSKKESNRKQKSKLANLYTEVKLVGA